MEIENFGNFAFQEPELTPSVSPPTTTAQKQKKDVDQMLQRAQDVYDKGLVRPVTIGNARENRKTETLSIRKQKTLQEQNKRRHFEPLPKKELEENSETNQTHSEYQYGIIPFFIDHVFCLFSLFFPQDLRYVDYTFQQLVQLESEYTDPSFYQLNPENPEIRLIPHYIRILSQDVDPQQHFISIYCIRKIISVEGCPYPVETLFESGLLQLIPWYLANHNEFEWQSELTWILSNLSCATSTTSIAKLVNSENENVPSILDMIIKILVSSGNQQIISNCIWIIANISATNGSMRDIVVNRCGLSALVFMAEKMFQPDFVFEVGDLLSNLIWAFSAMCISTPELDMDSVKSILPYFSSILENHERYEYNILLDVCCGIEAISAASQQDLQLIIENELLKKTLCLWPYHFNDDISYRIFKIVGNTYSGSIGQRKYMNDLKGLAFLSEMLDSEQGRLIRMTCRIIARLSYAIDYSQDIISIFEERDEKNGTLLMSKVVTIIRNCNETDTKKEAIRIINNMVVNQNQKICEMIACFEDLPIEITKCLKIQDYETKCMCLEILACMFNSCKIGDTQKYASLLEETQSEGLGDILAQLQMSENHNIFEKAEHILTYHLDKYDEKDEVMLNFTSEEFIASLNFVECQPIPPPTYNSKADFGYFF